jgi:hypothetical protein
MKDIKPADISGIKRGNILAYADVNLLGDNIDTITKTQKL